MLRSRQMTALITFVSLAAILARGELPRVARVGPFDFWIRPFELRTIPTGEWPYNRETRVQLSGDSDADGVRVVQGRRWHPV
jgi:hypothetical protein